MMPVVSSTRRRWSAVLPLTVLLLVLLFTSAETTSENDSQRRTAVLFGATGAVGSEAMRSLLLYNSYRGAPFWKDIILVGRSKAAPTIESESSLMPIVTQITVEDMAVVDKAEALKSRKADACIVAVGSSSPMGLTLREWHDIDVVLPAAVARLCRSMGAKYISLLSAVDSEEAPTSFDEAEIAEGDDTTLGWWGMLVRYARVKGLAERAVSSAGISTVRIFQPSNIVTRQTRYGWFDRILFQILPYIDPIMPQQYRSVPVQLLGMAMAVDAAQMLESYGETRSSADAVAKLSHGDFSDIAGDWYHAGEKEQKTDVTDEL